MCIRDRTRVGSLSGAVGEITGGTGRAPGAAVQGLDGGMAGLVEALVARIELLGSEVRTATPVERLDRDGDRWIVRAVESEEPGEQGQDLSLIHI